jgi:hypothetical protein
MTGTLPHVAPAAGVLLLQTGGQLNYAELLAEATRAAGWLAPKPGGAAAGESPYRHLAYWLMKGLVLVERDGRPADRAGHRTGAAP